MIAVPFPKYAQLLQNENGFQTFHRRYLTLLSVGPPRVHDSARNADSWAIAIM